MKNKNRMIIFILIGVFCVLAIIAAIYAQFIATDYDDIGDEPTINVGNNNNTGVEREKNQDEIKTQFNGLFTNTVNTGDYDLSTVDKLYDDRDIVYSAYTINESNDNYEINVNLPVVNIAGDVVSEFNGITQELFADKAAEVMNSVNAYKTIYNVDYAVFINNGILSVAIKSLLKEGNNPQRTIVQTYNYDLQTGERVEIGRILSNLGLTIDEVQNKIREIVNEAAEAANILEQSGYSVFKRNLEDSMYNMNNLTTYMLGPSNELYIIFAYGNRNFTSEMDIVLYE